MGAISILHSALLRRCATAVRHVSPSSRGKRSADHLEWVVADARSLGEIARKDFRVRAAAAMVAGWVGTVDPAKRTADFVPGLRCYRLGRLVKDGEFFGHPTPAQEPGMAQLIGEVEIPRVPLTINKSDFDRDSAPWVDIEPRLHILLKPIARQQARSANPSTASRWPNTNAASTRSSSWLSDSAGAGAKRGRQPLSSRSCSTPRTKRRRSPTRLFD